MVKEIAILAIGPWGKRIARNISEDRRFSIVSLMANFSEEDEIWRYAVRRAQLGHQNGATKEVIREKLVDHGLVPTMKELEGEEEDSPDAHKKTVDIVISDMGSDINDDVVTALASHVRTRIFVHAADSIERKKFEKSGAVAICPDIDGCGADHMTPLLIETHIKLMGDELGEWHGAVMPVPSAWTGRPVVEIEEQYSVGIVLVRSEVIVEKKGKKIETKKETFRPDSLYVFREEDQDIKIISRDHKNILKAEAEIDKKN